MKYYLAQFICYSGDGVVWTRLYKTGNSDCQKYIYDIALSELHHNGWYESSYMKLVINEVLPETL